MTASTPRVPPDGPIGPELLADLQAGLLDDATAARLRRRVRTDPEAAATLAGLDRVRRDLATLGSDTESAEPVPAEVSARVSAALRAAGTARPDRPAAPRWRLFGAIAGGCAAVLLAGLGAGMLMRTPGPVPSGPTSLGRITASPVPTDLGLPEPQLLELLAARPDYGPLSDPQRRTACLTGLGYPSGVRILGARPLDVRDRHGVLMLLPTDTPGGITGLVVPDGCGSGNNAPLARTVLRRP
ncbi:hypothetical protein ACWDTP_10090 [Mycobacterium sp. NPDC003449]